jgi:hypothetical protein
METLKASLHLSDIDKLLVPIKGDIYFHKNISPMIARSNLEKIALDAGFCIVKYAALAGLSYSLCEFFNHLYSWPDGADLLKGV